MAVRSTVLRGVFTGRKAFLLELLTVDRALLVHACDLVEKYWLLLGSSSLRLLAVCILDVSIH